MNETDFVPAFFAPMVSLNLICAGRQFSILVTMVSFMKDEESTLLVHIGKLFKAIY